MTPEASVEGNSLSRKVAKGRAEMSRLLHERTIFVLAVMFIIGLLVVLWYVARMQAALVTSATLQSAAVYSDALAEFRTLYTSEVVETVRKHGIEVTHDYATREKAIPLPATLSMLLGEKIGAHRSGAKTRLYSAYPFPWRRDKGGLQDAFGEEAWHFLQQHTAPFFRVEEFQGRLSLRYATADVMRPSCVSCHNTHPQSPKTDWKTGEIRGVLEVILPIDAAATQQQTGLQETFALLVVMSLLGLSGLALVVGKLRRSSEQAQALAREIKQANDELEDRVWQRTEALTAANDALDAKNVELEGKNAELERFTYTVSHDLKTPLVTIKGFIGLLQQDIRASDVERVEHDIAKIGGAADEMSRLLEELLELSRIGRVMNSPEKVSLTDLVSETVDLVAGQIDERGVVVAIAPAMPTVYGDRVRLLEVFQNLIDNAVKFMGEQPDPRVEIDAEAHDTKVVCSVRDNGMGINPRYQEKIFELFQRLDVRVEGTGIGLALVKRIVEVHGGHIWVESEGEGHGSTFYFTLPNNAVTRRH